jgi:hypothetical protein
MSTLETKKIEPLSGTSVTLGAAGDAVTMPAGVTVKTNTAKDAGGNTLWTSDGSGTLSSVNSALQGNMIFISSATASSSASVEFTSGIDSTYDEYMFVCTDIGPATNNSEFGFQVNVVGETGYNETVTSCFFSDWHLENNSSAGVGYHTDFDQAQGTSNVVISRELGNGADESTAGILHLFAPSNTTYVTHFYSRFSGYVHDDAAKGSFVAGYFNVTGAIDEIQFKMDSGNFDGTIAMYGIR